MTTFRPEHSTLNTLPLNDFLDHLSSGVVILAPKTFHVLWMNATLKEWLGISEEEIFDGPSLHSLLSLPPKKEFPFLSKTVGHALTPHAAFLKPGVLKPSEGSDAEPIKVKVKYSLLQSDHLVCMIDPFAEDVSLTQAHNDFVSTVSHEFRTPLTSIKGFADTLLRYGAQLPADQQRRFITIIKDQADRLTRLVENLLAVSRLGAGKTDLVYRTIPLNRLVDKVIQNIQGKGNPDREFMVNIPPTLPELWADPDKFEQVMLNLVDNAVKYSFNGTKVKVSATVLKAPVQTSAESSPARSSDEGDLIEIRIQDEGVGIPAENLPRIFTKFSRIDNVLTREVEGTGLGLYITKSLTVAMGGHISVESESKKGTTFILKFPVATEARQADYRKQQESEMETENLDHDSREYSFSTEPETDGTLGMTP